MTWNIRVRGPIALLVAALGLAIAAGSASAMVISSQTFKVSIDVKLDLTERSTWQGIRPGCYAPQEDFDMTYHLGVDSRPDGKKSKVKDAVATLTGGLFGTTPAYGAKRSFRQYSSASPWTIETQYPAGCDGPAPAAPAWAVSPACNRISERVEATLTQSDIDDPDDPTAVKKSSDGSLLLIRTPKAAPTLTAANMGESCYRTLHDIVPTGLDSLLEIQPQQTLMSIPIPNLDDKLSRIAKGADKSHPIFRIPIKVSGDCNGMHMRPTNGARPDFTQTPFSQPHNALGAFNGDASKTVCTISGNGDAIVRRESAVVSTAVLLKK